MNVDEAKRLTSPCGLPCFHCPAHLAIKNEEIRKLVAQTLGIPEKEAQCKGCRPQKGKIAIIDKDKQCQLFQCSESKKVDFCNECADFPCNRFQPYADKANFPHNTKMFQLCMMKKLGFEQWSKEEAAKIWDKYRTEEFSFEKILF